MYPTVPYNVPLKTSILTILCVADLDKEQMTYRGGGSLACEEADWPRAASGFFPIEWAASVCLPIGWAASGRLPIGWAGGPATVRISEAASFQFLLITMSNVAATAGSKETAVRTAWKRKAVRQLDRSFINEGHCCHWFLDKHLTCICDITLIRS